MKWVRELRALLSRMKGHEPRRETGSAVTCEEALERLFEWLDGELEGEEAEKVGRHLEICGRCYPALTFERAFQEALKRAKADEDAPARLKSSILAVLEEEGFRKE